MTHISQLYISGLTETQVQTVLESHSNLLNDSFLATLKGSAVALLSKPEVAAAVSATEINNLTRMFDSLINMYEGFNSSYLRFKEYENCGALIKPVEFSTGTALLEVTKNGKVILEPVELKGQFIKFRDVLKGFLELPNVFNVIMDYISFLECNSDKGVENVIQSKFWQGKIKPMFEDKIVLPLSFLFDDFETGKELGFHTCVHSLGAGYIRLLSVPPQFYSQLENIFLVLLFYSSDKDFGNKKVFGKVVEELSFLETEGITIVTANSKYQVYFALCFAGGDNKGANEMLGYVKSFSANKYCRVCSLHKLELAKATQPNPAAKRTPECYNEELVIDNQTLTGRSGECVFNALRCYHVYENFHLDIMHDWDHGIWKYLMTDVVRYFVDRVCTLEYLNELIQGFYYGPNENRNKPPLILCDHLKADHTLRFSASEMRCLVRYFGLIAGHLVEDRKHRLVWKLYLLTRKIADMITAPRVLNSDPDDMGVLIDQHHTLYLKLFPGPLKPKFHFGTHCAELMDSVGPLEPLSCIRIEAKHKEGTDVAGRSNNRINLPHTVAHHHQLMLAFRFLAGRGLKANFEHGKICVQSVYSLADYLSFIDIVPNDIQFQTVKWVRTNGMTYRENSIVLISVVEDVPVFGRIHIICVNGTNVSLILQCLQTIQFQDHVHAYEVECIHDWKYISLNDLHSHVATDIRLYRGKQHVPFRYSVRRC